MQKRLSTLPMTLTLALTLATCGGLYWGISQWLFTPLSLPQVERLRMQAPTVPEALAQLRTAARHEQREAQRALAQLWLTGPNSQDSSHWQEGLKYAELAAKQGDREAWLLLAQAYLYGRGGARDYPRARYWFERAAQQQSAAAAYGLGLMYKSGYGGPRDPAMAYNWFVQAAQKGHADAMFMLGNAYQDGEGVTADAELASKWFQAAAQLEHPLALQSLATLQTNPALRAHLLQELGEEVARPQWLAH